jgi:myo-inositol-1(or 4)-monophosphatase
MFSDNQIVLSLLMKAAKIYANTDGVLSRREVLRKNDSVRDIVTALDLTLHDELSKLAQKNSGIIVFSEEGYTNAHNLENYVSDTLLIDPLDGSSNYAHSLNFYCTIVALIKGKKIVQAGVCLPNESQISTWDLDSARTKSTKFIDQVMVGEGATYYAYPPVQSESDMLLRQRIMKNIDEMSSGLIRWGSAGCGLYFLMIGSLQSFVGHKIRIWDGLAFMPMLESYGIQVAYKIDGTDLIMIASTNNEQFKKLCAEFLRGGHELYIYKPNSELKL